MRSLFGMIQDNVGNVMGFLISDQGWLYLIVDDVDSAWIKGRQAAYNENEAAYEPIGNYYYIRLNTILAVNMKDR